MVELKGVEPLFPVCGTDVLPLNDSPKHARWCAITKRQAFVKLVGWVVRLSLLSGGVTYAAQSEYSLRAPIP